MSCSAVLSWRAVEVQRSDAGLWLPVSARQPCSADHQHGNLACVSFTLTAPQYCVESVWCQLLSGLRSLIFYFFSPACRATSNNKVKDMVLLELSYVNSNLQLLMGQLEGLNSSVDVYQNTQWVHMLPLYWFSSWSSCWSNMVPATMCQACVWLVSVSLQTSRCSQLVCWPPALIMLKVVFVYIDLIMMTAGYL